MADVSHRFSEFFKNNGRRILVAVIAVIVILLVIPPVLVLIFSSVNATKGTFPFQTLWITFQNYIDVFSSSYTYELILNTVWYVVGTVLLTFLLTMLLAWFLERTNMYWRRFLFAMTLVPMAIPGVVFGMSWILLANPTSGLLNEILRRVFHLTSTYGPLNIYSIPGMIIVSAMRFVPLMYLMVGGVFSRIDPSFEEASKTCGGGFFTTLRRVSLPLISPTLFSAVIYFAVMGIEAFEIAALLGAPKGIYVLSTAIYYTVHPATGLPNYGQASVYSVLLLLVALVFIYFYRKYTRRGERFTTVTGKGFRPRLIKLGRLRWLPTALMALYFVIVVGAPTFVLIWKSLAPQYAPYALSTIAQFSLTHYKRVLTYYGMGKALWNTIIIGIVSSVATMLISSLLSWQAVRQRDSKLAGFAEYLAFAITGVPSVVMAVALIFIYVYLPVPIYGSIWIIVIGLVTKNLPFGVSLMNGSFLQIHKELEEAAETAGASPFVVLRTVVFPIIRPSFLRGFFQVFVKAISDSTIALMLLSFGNQMVTTLLWSIWDTEGNFSLACAIAVPFLLFSVVLSLCVGRMTMFSDNSEKS